MADLQLVTDNLPTEEAVRIHATLVATELQRLARLQLAFTNLAEMAANVTQEALDAANALQELREQHG